MSYTTVRDGLAAVVETQKPAIKEVLKYEPGSIQVSPLAWVLLDGFEHVALARGSWIRWRFVIRVASAVTDSAEAEAELIQAALGVVVAIDSNSQFSGVLVAGNATAPDGQSGWILLGNVKCRVLDITCSAFEALNYPPVL